MDDQELYDEILWVLEKYGSDAGEKMEPGSKAKAQALRIHNFVIQREEARSLLNYKDLDLVKVVSNSVR